MNWIKIGKRLLFPHSAVLCVLVPAAAVLLIYSFLAAETTDIISIVSYVLSFYALIIVCLRIPDMIRFAKQFKSGNKYVARYTSDMRLRMNISLQGSFAVNAAYALFQLCLGLWHSSVWFYAMAVYYLLLAMMRLSLARHTTQYTFGERLESEWKKYRFCGICLLCMNLALSVIIIYFIWRIRTFKHHEITTIAMAAFTFTSFTMAVINAIRYKNDNSPVCSAVRAISLATGIVSMLTLENALLTAFGQENSELFRQIMLGLTGTGVILSVQGISIYMILKSGRMLKDAKSVR